MRPFPHFRGFGRVLALNSRPWRQVFDCGDKAGQVTVLAVAPPYIPKLVAHPAAAKQSGESENSVAALQDADISTRFAVGSWLRCGSLFMFWMCLMQVTFSGTLSDGPWPRVPNTTLRMPPTLSDVEALPATLADTGAFSDLINLTPNVGLVAYDVNVPFWSDGAHKTRWFCVPDPDLKIGFHREAPWSFPIGAVWIKHFELPLINGVATSMRRIETRLLVRTADGAYGVTYRWDASQTNATLVAAEGQDEDIDIQEAGETHTQVWHYPSRDECLRCHQKAAGWALGFNTPQLNRPFHYGGVTTNQIAALSQAGYFATNVTGINTLTALAPATNTAWSLEYRVRSYLAANCAPCHQPGTDCLALWDARISTPTALAGIIQGPLVFPLRGDPAGRVITPGSLEHSMLFYRLSNLNSFHMPPVATTVLNTDAVNLLGEWITNGLVHYQTFADWQLAFFNSTDLPAAARDADPDNDGIANQLEYLIGTHPMLPGKEGRIALQSTGSAMQISFLRLANRSFEVQWTSSLRDPQAWAPLDVLGNRPLFSATNEPVIIEDTRGPSANRFYRVRIQEP